MTSEHIPTIQSVDSVVRPLVRNGLFGSTSSIEIAIKVIDMLEKAKRDREYRGLLSHPFHIPDADRVKMQAKRIDELGETIKRKNAIFADVVRANTDATIKVTALEAEKERLIKALDLRWFDPTREKFLGVSFDAWKRTQSAMEAVTHSANPEAWLEILSERHEAMKRKLKSEVEKAKVVVQQMSGQPIGCIACGENFQSTSGLLTHIRTCPKHPMRQLERENASLKATLQMKIKATVRNAERGIVDLSYEPKLADSERDAELVNLRTQLIDLQRKHERLVKSRRKPKAIKRAKAKRK